MATTNLIKKRAVADKLGVEVITLTRMIHDQRVGFPKGVRIRTHWYFSEPEVDDWIAEQATLEQPRKKIVSNLPRIKARAEQPFAELNLVP